MLETKRTMMKRAQVAIIKGTNAIQQATEGLNSIEAYKAIKPGDRILIKPNYVTADHPSTGITTSSDIVEAIILYLKDHGFQDITIGEGGVPGNTLRAFEVTGIKEVVKRHQLKLVNLNKDEMVKVNIPNASALKKVHIARTALDASCIISVPKLKVHHLAYITGGMKNMMGAIWPKSIMHKKIHEKIVDLTSLLTPKITVVDGIIGAEKNETTGTPVKMDLVIAGTDVVAVDAVCASVMGINPKEVPHLQIAAARGLGTADMDLIDIMGESLSKIMHHFELPEKYRT